MKRPFRREEVLTKDRECSRQLVIPLTLTPGMESAIHNAALPSVGLNQALIRKIYDAVVVESLRHAQAKR